MKFFDNFVVVVVFFCNCVVAVVMGMDSRFVVVVVMKTDSGFVVVVVRGMDSGFVVVVVEETNSGFVVVVLKGTNSGFVVVVIFESYVGLYVVVVMVLVGCVAVMTEGFAVCFVDEVWTLVVVVDCNSNAVVLVDSFVVEVMFD